MLEKSTFISPVANSLVPQDVHKFVRPSVLLSQPGNCAFGKMKGGVWLGWFGIVDIFGLVCFGWNWTNRKIKLVILKDSVKIFFFTKLLTF